MTHQRLREKAEAVKSQIYLEAGHTLSFEVCALLDSLLAELDAAKKDAERADDQRLTLVNVFHRMSISPILEFTWTESEQAAIDVALNADGEKRDER